MSFKSLNKKKYMIDQPDVSMTNPVTGGFVYFTGRFFKALQIVTILTRRDNAATSKIASIETSVSHF